MNSLKIHFSKNERANQLIDILFASRVAAVKQLNDELGKFKEVDNLNHLSYMELMQLNTYVENKYQIAERKEKEYYPHRFLPTPKPEPVVQSSSEKTVDKKIKPR